jgi:hypothetical protein
MTYSTSLWSLWSDFPNNDLDNLLLLLFSDHLIPSESMTVMTRNGDPVSAPHTQIHASETE